MSGRRLLDAALVFSATRRVARNHFQIRSEQIDLWRKTSAIAKVFRRNDLYNAPASYSSDIAAQQYKLYVTQTQKHVEETVPTEESVDGRGDRVIQRTGLQQDHHYKRSQENTISDPVPKEALGTQQVTSDRFPTPDGSIPPVDAPLETGAPQNATPDVYSDRAAAPRPVSLVEDEQSASWSPVSSKESTIPDPLVKASTQIPEQDVVPEQEETPEGINTDVFHSPRVARLLGGSRKQSGGDLAIKGAKDAPVEQSPLGEGKDQDTFNIRQGGSSTIKDEIAEQKPENTKAHITDHDTRDLANSIAADAGLISDLSQEQVAPVDPKPYQMRESRVPSSRFGRLWQYGGLATSMAFGAVGESFRRATGNGTPGGSLMLSAANMERLVTKLSRMRGAALKLGQMMSFQDSKMLPAPIAEVLRRVQDNADYMPASQRNRVLSDNLGAEWRSLFSSFDEVPVAAASIGQVHHAVLASSNTPVAVKIQYPGVATSISSDLSNLSVLLTATRLLPKGLYLDKTIANARTELGWECDYQREAECQMRFRDLVLDEQATFTVPKVFLEACGPQVLTAEFMSGIGVTKPALNLDQAQRDWIGTNILRLCLRELMEFKFMQTDPNWTNFLFNSKTNRLELLDFGAAREYPDKFVDPYVSLLLAAAAHDRNTVRDLSVQLGYLTGHESRTMEDAHIASVMTLAEPFLQGASIEEPYDFKDQTITDRVRGLIPVMIKERLAPPPEETYSLHRKLSGAFLLLARLGSRVKCRELFVNAVEGWKSRRSGRENVE